MTLPPLGRLESVDLRKIWTSEASDFAPWLARPENIAELANTLDMDLEVEAGSGKSGGPILRRHPVQGHQHQPVGAYRESA